MMRNKIHAIKHITKYINANHDNKYYKPILTNQYLEAFTMR